MEMKIQWESNPESMMEMRKGLQVQESTDTSLTVNLISLAAPETKDITYTEANPKKYSEILG